MDRKAGIVAAAVLGVNDQGNIQRQCFGQGILSVLAQHIQDILRRAQIGVRVMKEKAGAVAQIIGVGLIAVNRQLRKHGDQLNTLPQYVLQAHILRLRIVAVVGQNAAGHGVHHIGAGRLHDDVPYKAVGQAPVAPQHLVEFLQLLFGGKPPDQQQINCLLKAKAPVLQCAADQIVDVISPVEKLPFHRFAHGAGSVDVADFRKAGQNALSRHVPQPPVDPEFFIQFPVNHVPAAQLRVMVNFGGDLRIVSFGHVYLPPLSSDKTRKGNRPLLPEITVPFSFPVPAV